MKKKKKKTFHKVDFAERADHSVSERKRKTGQLPRTCQEQK